MKVEISEQVAAFIRQQAPEGRRRLRLALRQLERERGDRKSLEGPLSGYQRLRVGPYRIIYAQTANVESGVCIRCIFAERRDTVYAVFSAMLKRRLLQDE